MIRIRQSTLEDAAALSRIQCLCYEGFGKTDDFNDDIVIQLKNSRGSPEHLREFIMNENVFVAGDEQSVKGMVSIKDNEISKLYVDPHHQKQGIGWELFNYAEAFIRTHGYEGMFVETAARTAIPFYERMGMRVSQTRRIDCGPCIGMTSIILDKSFGP